MQGRIDIYMSHGTLVAIQTIQSIHLIFLQLAPFRYTCPLLTGYEPGFALSLLIKSNQT